MKRPGYDGECWPDDLQTTLLRVALCDPDTARREWCSLRDELVLDDIWDPEIHRLLPLVHRTLLDAGVDDPEMPRMKGIHRRCWFENQRRIHEMIPVLDQLRTAGVDTLLLKGVPLAVLYYRDMGLRPMTDMDVLIPYASFDRALDVLEADGWRDVLDIPRDRRRRMYHGTGLTHPDGRALDVHWQLALPFVLPHAEAESTHDFFAAAQPFDLSGFPARTLAPPDMLLHVLVHGIWSGSAASLRWAADATVVARVAGEALDWDRLLDETVRRDVVVPVSNGLRFIEAELGAPVPARVINELARVPISPRTRRAYRSILASNEESIVTGGLRSTYAFWMHQSYKWGAMRAARDLPAFLQDNWNLERPSQVPFEAVRKAMRRVTALRRATPAQ